MNEQQQDPSRVPFDPKMLEGADWETLNSLAYKFQGEAMQLADNSFVGSQNPQNAEAMQAAAVGGKAPPAPPPVTGYSSGKDDTMIQDWRARNKDRQDKEFKRLMEDRKKQRG